MGNGAWPLPILETGGRFTSTMFPSVLHRAVELALEVQDKTVDLVLCKVLGKTVVRSTSPGPPLPCRIVPMGLAYLYIH